MSRTLAQLYAFGLPPNRPHACKWLEKYHASLTLIDCKRCGAKPGVGCVKVLAVGDLDARPVGSLRVPPPMFDAHHARRTMSWEMACTSVHHFPNWQCRFAA